MAPKSRAPYPPEFRAEAIRSARNGGRPLAEIAHQLGMMAETMSMWLVRSTTAADTAVRRTAVLSYVR